MDNTAHFLWLGIALDKPLRRSFALLPVVVPESSSSRVGRKKRVWLRYVYRRGPYFTTREELIAARLEGRRIPAVRNGNVLRQLFLFSVSVY